MSDPNASLDCGDMEDAYVGKGLDDVARLKARVAELEEELVTEQAERFRLQVCNVELANEAIKQVGISTNLRKLLSGFEQLAENQRLQEGGE